MATAASPILRCMRPRQWTKNLLLFAGLVFTAHYSEPALLARVVVAFAAFCALSGVVYILNDIRDLEQDRLHPDKRKRPIASGELTPATAWLWAAGIGAAGVVVSIALGWRFAVVAAVYLALNLLYSWWLKRFVIIDVFCISFGFVLRAVAGIAAIVPVYPAIEITPWFLLCTFFLALFLAICKRRHEALLLSGNGASHREVLDEYGPEFLDQMVSVTTTATIIAYAMWTTLGQFGRSGFGAHHMLLTLPFVVFGIFRYLYLVYHRQKGGSPEQLLLTDLPLLGSIVLWLIAVLLLLKY